MPRNSRGIEIAEINSDKCIACQICIAECPVEAIHLTPDGVAQIDPETCVGCGKCAEVCPVEAVSFDQTKRRRKRKERPVPESGDYSGVAVFMETAQGRVADVSWELAGKARELADKRGAEVAGLCLGASVEGAVREAGRFGCDRVHIVEHPALAHYTSSLYGQALEQVVAGIKPEILLVGGTSLGRDLAGVVATRLGTGLTADCTGLDIEEDTGLLLMTRPTFGGNIMATIFCERKRPQMSTVRPRVMPMPEGADGRQAELRRHDWEPRDEGRAPELMEFWPEESGSGVDISKHPVLVVAGKGACDEGSFPLLEELARALGGMLACSRPVVESGWLPYERQVGQTGKTVAPKLYIGVGVSGAIQHRVAIQGASRIMAINTDPGAPIFQVADVGIVGDYKSVVPELIQQLKTRTEAADAGTL
jgi:electron transfer flavoprotein alpha subunit